MNNISYSSPAGLMLVLGFTFISFPLLSLSNGDGAITGISGYPDSPLRGHTGGFGELDCRSCHFDMPLNDPEGSLVLKGIPDHYIPGEGYMIEVHVQHPEMDRGGFQLSVRFSEGEELQGEQAGTLEPDSTDVKVTPAQDIQYAHHTEAGTAISSANSGRWTVNWTAPDEPAGMVVFHAAANAANNDDSEFGDFIYVEEVVTEGEL